MNMPSTKTCPWCDVQPYPEYASEGYKDGKYHVLRLKCPQCGVSRGIALSDEQVGMIDRKSLSLKREHPDAHFYMLQLRSAAEIAGDLLVDVWNNRKA